MNTRYILLTAAKNEEDYIGSAIAAVQGQSLTPVAWHIMDDGSTDATAQIVLQRGKEAPFIHLHQTPPGTKRDFGAQYRAINQLYQLAASADFDFVGVQDADITPKSATYYEIVLSMFDKDPNLGLAGGVIYERTDLTWQPRKSNSADSVAGGIQMFRRTCFDQLKGYTPLQYGGSDWLAQLMVMAAGWKVQANPLLPVFHYRPSSSADGAWRGLFRAGMMDASFDSHPLFELAKCAHRCSHPPYLIGSAIRLAGYLYWKACRRRTLIPSETAAFLRNTQVSRLRMSPLTSP